MSLGKPVKNEINAWVGTGIIVVLASVILLKFKGVSGVACNSGYTYNLTNNLCYLSTNASQTTTVNTLSGTIDTFVTAFSEPKNWVAIVIIGVIGFGLLAYYNAKSKSRK